MTAEVLYEDKWGEIIDRPGTEYIEIRWYDVTEEMTAEQFNQWLHKFADFVEQKRRPGALVDSTQFLMPLERISTGWRDKNIIPRYNAAGIKKFAFLMPSGMPAIGNTPAPEGPAAFPTGYFGRRAEALTWLAR